VASTGPTDIRSYYSSIGTAVFVSAPGGDSTEWASHMVTSLPGNECDNAGQGTSYACPIVSGVVALMLEANPNLTWRDVQEILAATSTMVDPNDPDWYGVSSSLSSTLVTHFLHTNFRIINDAGYHHSIKYGFGLVNASKAVDAALEFRDSPSQAMYALESVLEDITIPSNANISVPLNVTNASFVESVEHVVVYVSVSHARRGEVSLDLYSPSGTHSHVLWETAVSENSEIVEYKNFKVMSLQFWGENPNGVWHVTVGDKNDNGIDGTLNSVVVVLYGKCVHGSSSCRSVIGNLTAISEDELDVSEYESASMNTSQWCEYLKAQPVSTTPKDIDKDLICSVSWMWCSHYCGLATVYVVLLWIGVGIVNCCSLLLCWRFVQLVRRDGCNYCRCCKEMNLKTPTCKKNHPLVLGANVGKYPGRKFYCDLCRSSGDLPEGYSCVACKFDLCVACYRSTGSSSSSSSSMNSDSSGGGVEMSDVHIASLQEQCG